MARKLVVEIIGDASSLEKAFGKAEKSGKGFAGSIGKVSKAAAFGAGAAALGGLALVVKRGADEFADAQKQMAQTRAVLKSTGGSARVTTKHVTDLAGSLSKMSGVDDELIQSGENLLLTFTNIRNGVGKSNKIFDQATATVLDMSTALGQDTKQSAIQLGKALNDPVKGVGALKRVGVTFTEAQKKQIQALVKSGKTMQAQKVILKELRKEFGGSAKAAGDTLPGQLNKLKNSFDELAGRLVGKMAPALERVVGFLSDLLDIFSGSGSATSKFEKALERMGVQAETAGRIIDDLKETFNALKTVVVTTFNIIRPILGAFLTQIQGIVNLLDDLIHGRWKKLWGDAATIVKNTVKLWLTILETGAKLVGGVALKIGKALLGGIAKGLEGLGRKILDLIIAPINKVIDAANAALPGNPIPRIGGGGAGGGGGAASGSRAHTGALPPATTGLAPTPHPVTGPPGGRGAVVFNGPVNVHGVQDPNQFIKWAQRQARVTSPSRSGPFGGHNVGLT